MGAKGSKTKLSSKDLKFLHTHTGMSEDEIKSTFARFIANNPDGKLDRNEFRNLYDQLKAQPYQDISEITELVFKEFDTDKNGSDLTQKKLHITKHAKFISFKFENRFHFI